MTSLVWSDSEDQEQQESIRGVSQFIQTFSQPSLSVPAVGQELCPEPGLESSPRL